MNNGGANQTKAVKRCLRIHKRK